MSDHDREKQVRFSHLHDYNSSGTLARGMHEITVPFSHTVFLPVLRLSIMRDRYGFLI